MPKKYNPLLAIKVENPLPRLDLANLQRGGPAQATPISTPTPAATITNSTGSAGNSGGNPAVPIGTAGIPAYALARWATDYLPTLYAAWGALKCHPWEFPGGEIPWIQAVFDRVYPSSGYEVRVGCPVYTKVSHFRSP